MLWRLEVMEASMRHPLVDVLDRCEEVPGEGPEVTPVGVVDGKAVLNIQRFGLYLFVRTEEGATVSQGEWSLSGTLKDCCDAVAARHPVEG